MKQRVAYIVPLYTNDLHIVARKDIKTIRDLAGKRSCQSETSIYFSVSNIFGRLKISADIDSRRMMHWACRKC
jgi:TRAP-type uncharacterized transport system substrate-binding protein